MSKGKPVSFPQHPPKDPKKLVDYVQNGRNEITIGDHIISEMNNGTFFVRHADGEGAEVSADELEENISDFLKSVM